MTQERRKQKGWFEIVNKNSQYVFCYSFDNRYEAIREARELKEKTGESYYLWHIFCSKEI